MVYSAVPGVTPPPDRVSGRSRNRWVTTSLNRACAVAMGNRSMIRTRLPGRSGLGNAKKSVMSTEGSPITAGPLK